MLLCYTETLMKKINNYIQFISNNVKGLQSLEMRIRSLNTEKLHITLIKNVSNLMF